MFNRSIKIMKNTSIALICFLFLLSPLFAQNELYNDGAQITVESGALIRVEGEVKNAAGTLNNEGEIRLHGDWTNTASYRADQSGLVKFDGSNPANISGNMSGLNDFFYLTIDKTGSNKVVNLNTDVEVDQTLHFASGRLVTGSHDLFITRANVNALTGHPVAGSAVDDRYVQGYLKRAVSSGSNAWYAFPVGDAPNGLGLQLIRANFDQLGGTQTLTAFFQGSNNAASNLSECGTTYFCALNGHGRWMLLPDQTGATYNLLATPRNFNSACGTGAYTLLKGNQLEGDPCVAYTGILDGNNGTEVPRRNLTSFSPVTVAGSGGLLPVEWLSFDGEALDSRVRLEWITEHEINNEYFEVERSADGQDFYPLGQVAAEGGPELLTPYEYYDEAPLAGISYYRLRQVDIDGQYSFSHVVEVNFEQLAYFVWPNPCKGFFQLRTPDELAAYQLELYSLPGQLVLKQSFGPGLQRIAVGHLPEAPYFYRLLQSGKQVGQGKLIKME
jgi:hypothetical protein